MMLMCVICKLMFVFLLAVGLVRAGDSSAFFVQNATDISFVVTSLRTSCPCVTPYWQPEVVPPGQSTTIIAELAPEGLDGEVRKTLWVDIAWESEPGFATPAAVSDAKLPPIPAGKAAKVIEVKEGMKTMAISLVFRVQTSVKLEPSTVLFKQSGTQNVALGGINAAAFITEVVRPAVSIFRVAVADDRQSFQVTPSGGLPLGLAVEHWLVRTSDQERPELELSVRSQLAGPIAVSPTELRWQPGHERAQVLLRARDRDMTFKVLSASLSSGQGTAKVEKRGNNGWRILMEGVTEDTELQIRTDCVEMQEIAIPIKMR